MQYLYQRSNIIFYYFIIFCLERIKAYERNFFIYQDKNKGKEKGWAHQRQTQNHLTWEPRTHLIIRQFKQSLML